MKERIQKVLARAGVASRRACEEIVRTGRVTVDGVMITQPGTLVDAATEEIRVDGSRIRAEPPVYWLVNKPRGVLCTASDPENRRRVIDYVPDRQHRLFPVGRLDEDSEGLIIVTNDGELAQLVAHPRHGVEKIYDLSVRGDVSPEDARKIESGIWLSEGKAAAEHLRVKRRGKKVSHVVVTIREGRNREIRRMFARIERPVISLRRVQIGPIRDPRLRPGTCRRLTPEEVEELRVAASGGGPPPAGRPRRTRARRRPESREGAARSSSRGKPGGAGKPRSPVRGKPGGGPSRSPSKGKPPGAGPSRSPSKGKPPAASPSWSPSKGKPGGAGRPRSPGKGESAGAGPPRSPSRGRSGGRRDARSDPRRGEPGAPPGRGGQGPPRGPAKGRTRKRP